MHAQVPASADTQVVPFRNKVDYLLVAGIAVDALRGAVGRMVVDDNHVERKIGLLGQDGINGIGNGADAVAYGDDDRRLVGKFSFRKVDVPLYRRQESSDVL